MTFDFGNSPVAAHKHANGGGWVADSAHIAYFAYVGPDALVFEHAVVYGRVQDRGRVHGRACIGRSAQVKDDACVYENARLDENSQAICHALICGTTRLHGFVIVGGRICLCQDVSIRSQTPWVLQ